MHLDRTRRQTAAYILERACPSGGFCFYRLDEPTPHDTYYALASLEILGVSHASGRTAAFLRSLQDADGSFGPLPRTYFTLLSLGLLGVPPVHDPGKAVAALLRQVLASNRPPRPFQAQTYRDKDRACALSTATGLRLEPAMIDALQAMALRYGHPDGGFGVDGPSLDETRAAVSALGRIGRPPEPRGLAAFVRSCEDSTFGFTGKPGSSLPYLEYIHAGVCLCAALGTQPAFAAACGETVLRCRKASGGFARTETGIATLENTSLALQALACLNHGETKRGIATPP
ncbi:hypothetical protein ASZ90_002044 [hydrocarbon metagenome]|uniref:Prenyltransferase alpha-alpha toroid domain-containing protein n=1 Tax=hydrocarbon metagenome TaxID=938273 RepID=A0A0W8G4H1_9ZZZZ